MIRFAPSEPAKSARVAEDPAGLVADSLARVDEPSATEPRIQVQAAGDAVDVMGAER